jgi:hypothetical protein
VLGPKQAGYFQIFFQDSPAEFDFSRNDKLTFSFGPNAREIVNQGAKMPPLTEIDVGLHMAGVYVFGHGLISRQIDGVSDQASVRMLFVLINEGFVPGIREGAIRASILDHYIIPIRCVLAYQFKGRLR